MSALIAIDNPCVIVYIARFTPLVHGFLQRSVHFPTAESDLFSLLNDEVSKDGDRLSVLAINSELTAA